MSFWLDLRYSGGTRPLRVLPPPSRLGEDKNPAATRHFVIFSQVLSAVRRGVVTVIGVYERLMITFRLGRFSTKGLHCVLARRLRRSDYNIPPRVIAKDLGQLEAAQYIFDELQRAKVEVNIASTAEAKRSK